MAKNQKTNRTELEDLPIAEQELSKQEMDKVQGGAANLNLSKSNINRSPTVAPTPPPTGIIIDQDGLKVTG